MLFRSQTFQPVPATPPFKFLQIFDQGEYAPPCPHLHANFQIDSSPSSPTTILRPDPSARPDLRFNVFRPSCGPLCPLPLPQSIFHIIQTLFHNNIHHSTLASTTINRNHYKPALRHAPVHPAMTCPKSKTEVISVGA